MQRGSIFASVLASAVFLSSCGTLSTWSIDPEDKPEGRVVQAKDLDDRVGALAEAYIQDRHPPGLMIGLLLPDGTTRFYGYGLTKENGSKPDENTLFAVGSLSKGFLGAITAELVQENRLHWDDTLRKILPASVLLSDDASRITVEQLSTHMSGLPRQPYTETLLFHFVRYLFTGNNFYVDLDEASVFSYLATFSAPEENEPRYSNIGYAILGDLVERAAGKSLDELLAERITGPLGMSHTGYVPEDLPGWNERAYGHSGDQPKFIARGRPVPDWRFTEILRGAAAVYSDAHDLISFTSAYMVDDGSVRSKALADTLRVRFPRAREAAAINWIVDDIDGTQITYQVGNVAGYSSYLAVDVYHKTAVVVLQNAFNWDISLGHKLGLLLARTAP